MNILLNLTIKRRWFDMIASGEKREEYRKLDNMQVAKAYARSYCEPKVDGVIVLRNGYRMDCQALAVRVLSISLCMMSLPEHPEWGEPDYPHYAISFGEIVYRGTYAEVKEALEKKKQETERMKR
ncbi:MAG: hypothetical protein PUJ80_11595 [Verrucomicrobiota bacterium]|nr:hypothetical protein [Verrucomicrobiota bacterium]MDY5597075.1 hypothetical protein [Kiritimatiellia bacterium]